MDINLSLSAAPAITTNYLVVAVYEANPDGSAGPLLSFQALAAPHTSPVNVSFTGLDPKVCVVITYENSSAAVGGTIRHQFIYDPTYQNASFKVDEVLTVGTTTGFTAGGTSYTPSDNSWDGWDFEIEIRGSYGQLIKGTEWTKNTSPHTGFTVNLVDYTFTDGEIYIVKFYPSITNVTPQVNSGGAKIFDSVSVLTDDTTLTSSDMSKAIYLEGANPSITLTLPDITTVQENRLLPIVSEGGSHINATIACYGSDKIKWLSLNESELVLGQSETLWLFKYVNPSDSGDYHWKVINANTNISRVGQIVSSYLLPQSVDPVNAVFANGSLLSRTVYKRLWNYVQSLDSSALVSDANWTDSAQKNKGKYSTGDGSTTFRIPRLYDTGFIRGVDSSTRKAGAYQYQDLQPITLKLTMGNSFAGTPSLDSWAKTPGKGNDSPYENDDIPVGPTDSDNSTSVETRPANFGCYMLILI